MVPWPTVLVQVIDPPCCRTMLKTTARPSPVPARSGLVVKNGSKTRSTTSGGMPLPESVTDTATHGPGCRPAAPRVGRHHLGADAQDAARPASRRGR